MTITTFWQETYTVAAFQLLVGFVLAWLVSLDVGAWVLLTGICFGGLATGALIVDGAERLFRKLVGYRIRITIERA